MIKKINNSQQEKIDLIYSYVFQPTYSISFIPPTKEELRQQKIEAIKDKVKNLLIDSFFIILWLSWLITMWFYILRIL